MDLITWIAIGLCLALFFWFQFRGRVSLEDARKYIAQGALVVDVRTRQEFAEKRLPGTVNMPLDSVTRLIESRATDKSQVILCHCVSGGRSGIAAGRLRKAGYKQVFNLGSYGRAESVLPSKE